MMNPIMEGFIKVGTLGTLKVGKAATFDVEGVKVALFRSARGYVAVRDRCPHMGASLSEGRLTGNAVECAWHRWRFDAETGQSDSRSERCVAVYEVVVEDGDVFMKPPGKIDCPRDREEEEDEEWVTRDVDDFFRKRD